MEFLDIPFFDDDFYKMIFRFALNIAFLSIIIRGLYYSATKRRDYLFTYYMIGIIVFFLCFTLKKYELDIGMALGLFAIFGIIRYRTDPIEIKEMTYLFVIIGVSVINSLANQKMSYAEIIASNVIIVIALFIIEKMWLTPTPVVIKLPTKKIEYNNLDNIHPSKQNILLDELKKDTGLDIVSLEVGDINYTLGSVKLKITYNTQDKDEEVNN